MKAIHALLSFVIFIKFIDVTIATVSYTHLDVYKRQHQKNILPYRIFKVELTDLENGDRGEGLYYMEKENYIK